SCRLKTSNRQLPPTRLLTRRTEDPTSELTKEPITGSRLYRQVQIFSTNRAKNQPSRRGGDFRKRKPLVNPRPIAGSYRRLLKMKQNDPGTWIAKALNGDFRAAPAANSDDPDDFAIAGLLPLTGASMW